MTDPEVAAAQAPRLQVPGSGALERRVSQLVIVAGLIVWTTLLVWLPARFQGFDEAKYLGIGLNVLAGRGPLTAFDVFFAPHAPLWPIAIALPQVLFGIDAYAWDHVLVLAGSIAAVGLGAWFGWRIRPAAGALAVVAILAFPYVFELSRRLGLDMPVAALTLAYLAVGGMAVRRSGFGWAVAAGTILAVGFLVKESILPVAPVPFLAAIIASRPGAVTARVAAWTGLITVVLTSWWWWVYAAETGRVYRLGTPAWTLGPLLVGCLIAIAVGLSWPRVTAAVGRLGSGRMPGGLAPVAGPRVGWSLALLWVAAQMVFFSRTTELRGFGLVDPGQLAYYVDQWLDDLRPLFAIGAIGALLGVGTRIVRRRGPGAATDDLWLALVCSLPFVLLVIGVGEPPRHYVAQMILLLAIGSAGWVAMVEAAVRRPTPARAIVLLGAVLAAGYLLAPLLAGRRTLILVLAGLALLFLLTAIVIGSQRTRRRAARRWLREGGAVATLVIVAFAGAAGALTVGAAGLREGSPLDEAKAAALASVSTWVHESLPPGSTVAFGASLSQEMAVEIQSDYRVVQIREVRDVLFDAGAPLGVVRQGQKPTDDWIALSASALRPLTMNGYQAAPTIRQLRETGTDVWVQVDATDFGEPIVVDAALTPEHGFDKVATWSWPTAAGTLDATIFRVRPDQLAFDKTVWVSVEALRRLVEQLESDGSPTARSAAASLLERVRVHPEDPSGPALLERLRTLATG